MDIAKCFVVGCSILTTIYAAHSTTKEIAATERTANVTSINTNSSTSLTPVNATKHYTLIGNRTSALIINKDALRTRGSPNTVPKKVESLLYEEYDSTGKKITEYFMYNLMDVANFFRLYLNTDVCHVRCDTVVQ